MTVKAGLLCLATTLSMTSLRLAAATLQTKPADLIADFDRTVAQGFPARLSIGVADPRPRRGADDTAHQLIIESSIPANVTFAAGTQSRMYQGTFDDKSGRFSTGRERSSAGPTKKTRPTRRPISRSSC